MCDNLEIEIKCQYNRHNIYNTTLENEVLSYKSIKYTKADRQLQQSGWV